MTSPHTAAAVNATEGTKVTTANATTVTTDAVTTGAIAQTYSRATSSSATISSVEDLKKKDPKLYNMMMQGIAMNICGDMKHHQDRLKEMIRKGNDNS